MLDFFITYILTPAAFIWLFASAISAIVMFIWLIYSTFSKKNGWNFKL